MGTEELEGFTILTMGSGTKGWFNADEVMSFWTVIKRLSVKQVLTELTAHGYRYYVQESPPEVAAKLAETLGVPSLDGTFVILKMGTGNPGWFKGRGGDGLSSQRSRGSM